MPGTIKAVRSQIEPGKIEVEFPNEDDAGDALLIMVGSICQFFARISPGIAEPCDARFHQEGSTIIGEDPQIGGINCELRKKIAGEI